MTEQTNPLADAYYCELCDEAIADTAPVETPWGLMHVDCAASEPRDEEV
jgi:hypothetical protein